MYVRLMLGVVIVMGDFVFVCVCVCVCVRGGGGVYISECFVGG